MFENQSQPKCSLRMDSNNDGMITYDEFVQSVKTSGDSDLYRCTLFYSTKTSCFILYGALFRYIEPVMSVGFTVMGFLVYSVSLYVGLSVAWFVYQCLPSYLIHSSLPCTN